MLLLEHKRKKTLKNSDLEAVSRKTRPGNLSGPKSNSWKTMLRLPWKAALLICFRKGKITSKFQSLKHILTEDMRDFCNPGPWTELELWPLRCWCSAPLFEKRRLNVIKFLYACRSSLLWSKRKNVSMHFASKWFSLKKKKRSRVILFIKTFMVNSCGEIAGFHLFCLFHSQGKIPEDYFQLS